MTYEDIKQMNVGDLHSTLKEERNMLQKLNFNHAVSPIENPNKIRASKKLIARVLTEINSRRHATASEVATKQAEANS